MTQQAFIYYGELFGREYPFDKMDHVYCPEFNVGAMENVGLITYTERYIFRSTPTPSDITDLAEVVFVTGNIATASQARSYLEPEPVAAYVRVGVGSGGLCTTRLIAGTGVGQLSAIFDVAGTGLPVIADGGVRHPGDVAKALAAGSQVVMIGSLLAGTDETPGEVIDDGHGPRKFVRGQASFSYMIDNQIAVDKHRAPEGEAGFVPVKGSARTILTQVSGGLRSAMS